MIPISLSIEGFYSYQQKQIIDFEKLTKAGVFGIFGATGSGKSAIIEAVVYALYGESERINSREDRSYNMMNLQSNEFTIEFICYSDFTKTEYKIIAHAKRSKQFDKVSKTERVCYKKINSTWKPVDLSTIETEVTGLSYNNFIRTVIIPQGKFMDFLQLTATERTNMLKDLFNLHKFELSENVKILESNILHNKTLIEGNLQEVGEIEPSHIETLQLKEKEILEFGTKLKSNHIELQQKINEQTAIIADFTKLEQLEIENTKLLEQKQTFDTIEKQILNIDYCLKHFAPILDTINHKKNDVVKILNELTEITNTYNIALTNFKSIETEFTAVSKKHKELPEFEEKTLAILKYKDCKDIEITINSLQKTKHKGDEILKEILQKNSELELQITTKQSEIKKLKDSIEDIQTILKQKDELNIYLSFVKQIEECRNERDAIYIKITAIKNQTTEIALSFNLESDSITNTVSLLKNRCTEIEKEIEIIDIEIQHQKLQDKIAFLHANLHDGIACPVCGSLEHPNKNLVQFNTIDSSKNEEIKKNLQEKNKQINTSINSIELLNKELVELQKRDHEFSKKMHALTIERNLNEPDFTTRDIEVFNQKIKTFSNTNEEIQTLEKALQTLQNALSNSNANKETEQKKLSEIQNTLLELSTRYSTLKEQISNSIVIEFTDKSTKEIQEILQLRKNEALQLQEKHKRLAQEFETKNEEIKSLKISIQNLDTREKSINEELLKYNEELLFAIKNTDYSGEEEIQKILNQKDLLLQLSQSLEKHKHDTTITQKGIKELKQKLEGKTYDKENFIALQNQFKESETKLQESRDEYIRTTELLKQLTGKLEKYKKLTQQLQQCNHELENIYIMKSLFKQNGFVNFMSTRYMYMLCDIANKRFTKLTKHSLQLEIIDNGFCVRDFMNNGKLRHIKTLSGGQAFQAALSLALALSESIHNNSPIISNFFFIDEGFGSQDKESLSIVFETLRSLQNEGKTVGIISHVEELKENIPLYILVENGEKGSFIN